MTQGIPGRLFSICATVLGVWALLATYTRTGWIAFACGLLCLVAIGVRKRVFGAGFVTILLCLAPVGLLLFGNLVIERFTSNLETFDARKPLVKQAYYIIAQHPLFGVGVNTYDEILGRYIPEDMGRVWMYTVHNGYLYQWVEAGTIGLVVFLWFLFSLGWEAWKLPGAEDRAVRAIGVGAFSFLVAEAVFMNGVQWYVFGNSGLAFCALLAITAFLASQRSADVLQGRDVRGAATPRPLYAGISQVTRMEGSQ